MVAFEKTLNAVIFDPSSSVPLHAQLRNELKRIICCSMQNGDSLPPENYLVRSAKMSRGTVRRALADLSTEGLIRRKQGLGTVVVKGAPTSNKTTVAIITTDYPSEVNSLSIAAFSLYCQSSNSPLKVIYLPRGSTWSEIEPLLGFAPSEGGVVLLGLPQMTIKSLNEGLSYRGYLTVTDTYVENYSGNHVGGCDRTGVRIGVQYLKDRGHQNIVFLLSEPEEHDSNKKRTESFEEAVKDFGLPRSRVYHAGTHAWENASEAAAEAMPYVWNSAPKPTAIFAGSDATAVGALGWLQRNNIRVPEDVAILSFDGSRLTRMCQPKLSTLAHDRNRYVEETMKILQERNLSQKRIYIVPSLVESQST